MKLLLLGATGLVGSRILQLALSDDACTQVIAPTRQPLAPANKLVNRVASALEDLIPESMLNPPDAVICALGTTQAKAGSKQAFHYVDHELPIAFGEAAHSAGVQRYAIVTAMGANDKSMSFYYKTKGEVEKAIKKIGFRSLTICRPSLIGGPRNEARRAEAAAIAAIRILAPILPKKFHVNSADVIAAALLRAIWAAEPGCHWITADRMH
jgi:uncharacterized protein YbjT (DUF2867 family)